MLLKKTITGTFAYNIGKPLPISSILIVSQGLVQSTKEELRRALEKSSRYQNL